MIDDNKLEGEDIQKGLESFLDKEINDINLLAGASGSERKPDPVISEPPVWKQDTGVIPDINVIGSDGSTGYIDEPEIDVIGGVNEIDNPYYDEGDYLAARSGKSSVERPVRRPVARPDDTIYPEYDDIEDRRERREDYRERPVEYRDRPVRKKKDTSDRRFEENFDRYDDRRSDDGGYNDRYSDRYDRRAEKKAIKEAEKKAAKKAAKKASKKATRKAEKKAARHDKGRDKNGRNENGKKKKSGLRKFLTFILILCLIGGAILYMVVGSCYKKMKYERVDSVAHERVKQKGVINILLIGNDSRSDGEDGRSDAMILLSISSKTKTVMMTSLLRDMYVDIPGHDSHRLNSAYSWGGPELLMETIEQNFGIPVDRYVLVNFQAFAALVDAVGGIDMDLSNEEVKLVNGYLMEYNELRGMDLTTDWLDQNASGNLHLNGAQALAYTRNRYIGTDFGRTERQRKVLEQVFKKLPKAAVTNFDEISDGLFPNLTTNLTQNECFMISLNGWKLVTYERGQQMIPAEDTYHDATIKGMMVLEVDKDANHAALMESIYGE